MDVVKGTEEGETSTQTIISGEVKTQIARKLIAKEVTASDVRATFGLSYATPYSWMETLTEKDRGGAPGQSINPLASTAGGRPRVFDGTAKDSWQRDIDSKQRKNKSMKLTSYSTQAELLKYANETKVGTIYKIS
jgi:hypothetical protein